MKWTAAIITAAVTIRECSLCRADITTKWPMIIIKIQTKTHDISFVLSAGPAKVLNLNIEEEQFF